MNKTILVVVAAIVLVVVASFLYTATDDQDVERSTENGSADKASVAEVEATAVIDTGIADVFEGVEYSEIGFNTSFTHTKPGEYSDIYVDIEGMNPNEYTIIYLRKAGTEDYVGGGQALTADDNGKISTEFRITEFEKYEVYLSHDGETFISAPIVVE